MSTRPFDHSWQGARHLPALKDGYFKVDDRDRAQLIAQLGRIASHIRFAGTAPDAPRDWSTFFDRDLTFLLAEIASTPAQELYAETLGRSGRGLKPALEGSVDRLADWHRRARALAALAPDGSVEVDTLAMIETALSEQLEPLAGDQRLAQLNLTPQARTVLDAPAPSYRALYSSATQAVALLSAQARDLLTRCLRGKHDHQPHIGLYLSFVDLMTVLQDAVNQFPARHLSYCYRDRLGATPLHPVADRVDLALTLLPGISQHRLGRGSRFAATDPETGAKAVFETGRDALLDQAQLASVLSLYRPGGPGTKAGQGRIVQNVMSRTAPDTRRMMASRGGWYPFDQAGGAEPGLGFGIASHGFALAGGQRHISLVLHFDNAPDMLAARLDAGQESDEATKTAQVTTLIEAALTDAQGGWITPAMTAHLSGSALHIDLKLDAAAPAIGPGPAAPWAGAKPVLRLRFINAQGGNLAHVLRDCRLNRVEVSAKVTDWSTPEANSQLGPVDMTKPFALFGPVPVRQDFLDLSHPDLQGKQINWMRVALDWQYLPEPDGTLASHYAGYNLDVSNDRFRVAFEALTPAGWTSLPPPGASRSDQPDRALFATDGGRVAPGRILDARPAAPLPVQSIRLRLTAPEFGFGHAAYPQVLADAAIRASRQWWWTRLRAQPIAQPRAPFVPMVKRLALSYACAETISPATAGGALVSFLPFGVIRPVPATAPALPLPDTDATLYLGFQKLVPGRSLSLLVNIENATTDQWMSNAPPPVTRLVLGYLSGDQWRALSDASVLEDSTLGLMRSGVIRIRTPQDWTDRSSLIPDGQFWLSLAVADGARRRIYHIATQAVSVTRDLAASDAAYSARLAPGRITRALGQSAPYLAQIVQPGPSRGGRRAEGEAAFQTRLSERLRHKGRGVLPADVEHLVLQHFPQIGDARCHVAQDGVLELVVARRRYRPDGRIVVHAGRLYQIADWIAQRVARTSGPIRVCSVREERVRMSGWLALDPNAPSTVLADVDALIARHVAPWRGSVDAPLPLGAARLDQDALTADLARLPGIAGLEGTSLVKFTRFDMGRDHPGGYWSIQDTAVQNDATSIILRSASPRSVLVPAASHPFRLMTWRPGVGLMEVSRDFIIAGRYADPDVLAREPLPYIPPQPAAIGTLKIGSELLLQPR